MSETVVYQSLLWSMTTSASSLMGVEPNAVGAFPTTVLTGELRGISCTQALISARGEGVFSVGSLLMISLCLICQTLLD